MAMIAARTLHRKSVIGAKGFHRAGLLIILAADGDHDGRNIDQIWTMHWT